MYWQNKMSHEDKAKVFKFAGIFGAIMTAIGWGLVVLSTDGQTPLVPTSFVILSLSILLANNQYDEFHRAQAHAGAIGGMMAVILWTALLPIISDYVNLQEWGIMKVSGDLRFAFYLAASGFFIGFFTKRIRG